MKQPVARPWRPGELAQALGVDPKTIRRWCKANRIRFIKLPGGHTRIPADEVARLLQEEQEK